MNFELYSILGTRNVMRLLECDDMHHPNRLIFGARTFLANVEMACCPTEFVDLEKVRCSTVDFVTDTISC